MFYGLLSISEKQSHAKPPRGKDTEGVVPPKHMMNAPETILHNRKHIAALAQSYEGEMVAFLRDLVAIPAESGHERPVIERIQPGNGKGGFR